MKKKQLFIIMCGISYCLSIPAPAYSGSQIHQNKNLINVHHVENKKCEQKR